MKFGQILVRRMINIFNMCLVQWCRLETSSKLFYDFIKTTVHPDLVILNSSDLPFLVVTYSLFQKNETLE